MKNNLPSFYQIICIAVINILHCEFHTIHVIYLSAFFKAVSLPQGKSYDCSNARVIIMEDGALQENITKYVYNSCGVW